jgi:hypothetical protein
MNELQERAQALDGLLFDICETLQLTETQHGKAEKRYKSIAQVIDAADGPFAAMESNLYPQGSMRLGTTVKPIVGPHDLDFVCEFAVSHDKIDPMKLLDEMYKLFSEHGIYEGMVEKKNRCIRVIYKDDFYLDILPACRDHINGGTCIQVPDRDAKDWKPSNPMAYAIWFENATQRIVVTRYRRSIAAMDKAASVQPIPEIQATEEKTVLQLIVQLLKRWRDVHYADSDFPPISVVLTTLAGNTYKGERLVSQALLSVLDGIVAKIDAAHRQGRRLEVLNPVHSEEYFSERWTGNDRAYEEFVRGIRHFATAWRDVCQRIMNPSAQFEELFGEGEVVKSAFIKQARELQWARESNKLGIRPSGIIASAATATTPMIRNTNHG